MTQAIDSRRTALVLLTTLVLAIVLCQPVAYGTALFKSPVLFDTGLGVEDLVAADFDSDGNLDLVITNYSSDTAQVMLGLGDGSFAALEPFDTGDAPDRAVCADFNLDERIDLAIANRIDNSIWVYLGDGQGNFQFLVALPSGNMPKALKTVDVNNDGFPDLITIHQLDAEARLYLGNGDGTFAQQLALPIGELGSGFECADFNGDGNIDLALGRNVGRRLAVFPGEGDGTFSDPLITLATDTPELIAAGDLNEDGVLDLVVGHNNLDQVRTYFGNGDGTFSSGDIFIFNDRPKHLEVVDLNNDGHLDLALSHTGSTLAGLKIYPGAGDGSFTGSEKIYVGGFPGRFDTGDFDSDGRRDAAVLAQGSAAVAIILGRDHSLPWSATQIPATSTIVGGMTVDDFDGNGLDDLAVAESDRLRILLFEDGGDYHWGNLVDLDDFAGAVETGDLNGDGIPDLATVQDFIDVLSVHLGTGDGTLLPFGEYSTGTFPSSVSIGDLNGDGNQDVTVGNSGSNSISVFINDGDGSLAAQSVVATIPHPSDHLLVDLDGDGRLDLVTASRDGSDGGGPGGVRVQRGVGNGTFEEADLYAAGGNITRITTGNLNADGAMDLAASNMDTDEAIILLNDGNGQFTEIQGLTCIDDPGDLLITDLDLDGHEDLAVALPGRYLAMTFSGNGDGSFDEARLYPIAKSCGTMVNGNFDGDGIPDLATSGGDHILIILPNAVSPNMLATGPGPGATNPPLVRTFNATDPSAHMSQWQAYGTVQFGVNVALGHLDGDILREVVTGPGPGPMFGPHVRGFDSDGTPLPGISFLAYGTNKFGANVACGDLDADGFDEIVTGAGPGAVFGPHVRGWNWDGAGTVQPIPGISYFAYGTHRWGVNVSCGDIDGDGFDEIVTGAGPGAVFGPHVRGWNWDGAGSAESIPGVSFLAYSTNKFGVNVACGDIDGDGLDEIVTGAGPGAVFSPHVRGWNWDGTGTVQPIPGLNFFAYTHHSSWGVYISCGDLDDDGIDELLTGPGPGPAHSAHVRGWNYDGKTLTALGNVDFTAFNATTHGVKVAGSRN